MSNLTSKELAALEDQLGAEQTLIKKYTMYAQLTSEPQIKTQCENNAAKHQNHFNRLISYLN